MVDEIDLERMQRTLNNEGGLFIAEQMALVAEVRRLRLVVQGEQEARRKLDAAYRGRDRQCDALMKQMTPDQIERARQEIDSPTPGQDSERPTPYTRIP